MPKIKTRKSAAKRLVKTTSRGLLLRRRILAQHLVHRKSKRSVKQSGGSLVFSKGEREKIKKLIPYRKK